MSLSTLEAQDTLLLDAGKKSTQFLLSRTDHSELTVISGKPGALEIWFFDSMLNQLFQASMPVEMQSLEGSRMFSFIDQDTLRLFVYYKAQGRLKSFAFHIYSGSGVFAGDFFTGAKFRTIGLRVFNNTMRLYLIPEEQNRLLVYFTEDGRMYDLDEYTIRIPAYYKRITQNPWNKYQQSGQEFVAQIETSTLDPPSYLSMPAKFYAWGGQVVLTIDDEDALHYQQINEMEQTTFYHRYLIRIPGVRQNQASYYSSVALEQGSIFRLTRSERQYYLSSMHAEVEELVSTYPLFTNAAPLDSLAQLYTETIERGRERRLKDREYKIKQLRRILNDGTAVLRIEQLPNNDTLLMDIGALRYVESVYTTQPRYNSLNYFDFGFDPMYHYPGQYYGRSSNYFIYDYIRSSYTQHNWTILTKDTPGLRLKMIETMNRLKEKTLPICYEVCKVSGKYYLIYQLKNGRMFLRPIE